MEGDIGDDNQSDSGVSVDFSPGSTMELHPASDDLSSIPALPDETPIEREIRQAAKREQSLRRSRGLSQTQEFIDIPVRRAILSQSLPAKVQWKDRQFAGKKMQREIKMETEREQVLVQLGKVPGFYDKGSVRQLRERKQLFEAFQESQLANMCLSKSLSSSSGDHQTLSVQGDSASIGGSVPEHQQTSQLLSKKQSLPLMPCGPTLSEGLQGQVIILESGFAPETSTTNQDQFLWSSHSKDSMAKAQGVTAVETASRTATAGFQSVDTKCDPTGKEEEGYDRETVLPRENPFFKLRSSMSLRPEVEQDIREARERERELQRQRNSLYGGGATGAASGQPANVERHVSLMPQNNLNSNDLASKTVLATAAARRSGKLDLVWPPGQVDMKKTGQVEVQASQSPWTSRQKHPLLQRWESGMVNGLEAERD